MGDVIAPDDQRREKRQNHHHAQKPKLLRDAGEDEVIVRGGQVAELLAPLAEADSQRATALDGKQ
ncbi:MAG: hypothetical protein AUJ96_15605 [Armatimonadetes bacterium CG2_30_66_41]|nr:MAG: hypothetical protein AUJ96_15605 [Armatimonadetes bacterium CG2_30_66_41]